MQQQALFGVYGINKPQPYIKKNNHMRVLLLSFLLLCHNLCFAWDNVFFLERKGNLLIEFPVGEKFELGLGKNVFILKELVHQLQTNNGFDKTPVYIFINPRIDITDSTSYFLGYGDMPNGWNLDGPFSSLKNAKGIMLMITDKNMKIPEVLNLLHFAYTNLKYIQTAQKQYKVGTVFQRDSVSSIPLSMVQQKLKSSNALIDKIMHRSISLDSLLPTDFGSLGLYYQNKLFHFFNKQDIEINDRESSHHASPKTTKELLIVPNVFEVKFTNTQDYFVFTDDSTFYFLSYRKTKFAGPYTIHGLNPRSPLLNCDYDYFPLERYVLVFDFYGIRDKVLFIPDSNLVISNYGNLEGEHITHLVSDLSQEQLEPGLPKLIYLLLILFMLSLFFNFYLWYKNK